MSAEAFAEPVVAPITTIAAEATRAAARREVVRGVAVLLLNSVSYEGGYGQRAPTPLVGTGVVQERIEERVPLIDRL
ncbi:hypothetical protein GCM10010315_01230 [Streptomyces luteosporeus]|uniref:Uncharacterized protein n=1 Tax=Streptomyces luteosporeus TaxID=173856 RepID=A0ABN3TJI4_9ACTN